MHPVCFCDRLDGLVLRPLQQSQVPMGVSSIVACGMIKPAIVEGDYAWDIALTDVQPLFGNKRSKTHWVVFMKSS